MARSVENVYADALLSVAKAEGKTEEILSDCRGLLSAFRETPEILERIADPGLSGEEKIGLFRDLFSGCIREETAGLLSTVLEKRREDRLIGILERFSDLAEESLSRATVSVRTAFPVTEKERVAIEEKVRATAGYETLRFTYETDESLVGGLVIRIGDRVVDGSVRSRLDKLTRELLKTRVE